MGALDGTIAAPKDCKHQWQTVSMVFESQLLDQSGRVIIRQPDTREGRVYLVCLGCATHTYLTTSWIGFRLYGAEDTDQESHERRSGFQPSEVEDGDDRG